MHFTLQPVKVSTGHDENGLLLFHGEKLVAVLVQLSEEEGVAPGQWFLEAGFGILHEAYVIFPDLDAAQEWIFKQIDCS